MKKVIVAGSRDFSNYDLLKKELDKICKSGYDVEIVSGTARGADTLGEQYAEENKLPLKMFLPDWDKHGKSAGYMRNREMAEYADACIVFWDGSSKGSRHMIDIAKELKLPTKVVLYKDIPTTN